jgi:hypothetical protein
METMEETKSILEEIVHLTEIRFPEIDTTMPHRRLSFRRTAHDARQ